MRPMTGGEKRPGRMYATPTKRAAIALPPRPVCGEYLHRRVQDGFRLPYLNTLSHSPRTFLKLRWAATQSLRPISFTLLRSIRNGRTFSGGV